MLKIYWDNDLQAVAEGSACECRLRNPYDWKDYWVPGKFGVQPVYEYSDLSVRYSFATHISIHQQTHYYIGLLEQYDRRMDARQALV